MLFSLQKSFKNRWNFDAILRDGNFAEILWKLGETHFLNFSLIWCIILAITSITDIAWVC